MVQVGSKHPKSVSKLNHELFTKAKEIMEDDTIPQTDWHMGLVNLSNVIDYLESNYNITPK
jgi:hypothetical protein|tara:strand:- start:3 stop:185 length:183 start_codon:yes stop_codon:yes gene_type:complete